jgi:hypothetical protein
MPLKYIIAIVLYLLLLMHVGLIYATLHQGLGWLLGVPIVIVFDLVVIPDAIRDWNSE